MYDDTGGIFQRTATVSINGSCLTWNTLAHILNVMLVGICRNRRAICTLCILTASTLARIQYKLEMR